MEWENDYSNDRNYCRHGTFIGDPFGPDYMCGLCEMGIDDYDDLEEEEESVELMEQVMEDHADGLMGLYIEEDSI